MRIGELQEISFLSTERKFATAHDKCTQELSVEIGQMPLDSAKPSYVRKVTTRTTRLGYLYVPGAVLRTRQRLTVFLQAESG